MKFMVHWSLPVGSAKEAYRRLAAGGDMEGPDVEILGAWLSVSHCDGWAMIETDDPEAIAKWIYAWADINTHEVTPVIEGADIGRVLGH